jgi:hypothetical protein
MAYLLSRLGDHLERLETSIRNLATLREALGGAEQEIAEDPVLTNEQRDLMVREARQRVEPPIEQVVAQIEQAKRDASGAISDGWKARTITQAARDRVRDSSDKEQPRSRSWTRPDASGTRRRSSMPPIVRPGGLEPPAF